MAETSATTDAARLIQAYQAGVWRYLRALGCDAALAEDLTQETFLQVLERPFQDYHPAATYVYLRTTARNLFISHQRQAKRQPALDELNEIDAAWQRWAEDDSGERVLEVLNTCLERLTDRARRALQLKFTHQNTRAEIAADLQLSEDGAKNLLQRAKQQLRECIDRGLRHDT